MDLDLDNALPGLKDVVLERFARMTLSLSTLDLILDSSSDAMASAWALVAKAVFCTSVLKDFSRLPKIMMTLFGPGIFNFMYV